MDGRMDGWISKRKEEGLEERRNRRNKDGETDGWAVGALVSGAGQVEPPDLPRLTGQDQEPSGGIPSSGRLWGCAPDCPRRDTRPQDGTGLQGPCASFWLCSLRGLSASVPGATSRARGAARAGAGMGFARWAWASLQPPFLLAATLWLCGPAGFFPFFLVGFPGFLFSEGVPDSARASHRQLEEAPAPSRESASQTPEPKMAWIRNSSETWRRGTQRGQRR